MSQLGILAVDLSGAWIGLAMAIGFVLGQALERWRGRPLARIVQESA
jgi:hypothetical protein